MIATAIRELRRSSRSQRRRSSYGACSIGICGRGGLLSAIGFSVPRMRTGPTGVQLLVGNPMPIDWTKAAAGARPPGDHASLLASFRRLTSWMRANGAPLLAENLAPGAKPGQIQKLEHKVGFKVPAGLRAFWLLHDGQRKALNGLIGPLQLLRITWVLNERERTLKLVGRFRGTRRGWKSAGLTPEEAESTHWLPIAARGDVSLIVHAGTGRVFAGDLTAADDETPVYLVAPSVPQWLSAYVESVEDDEFELVAGLGDYYLSPREIPD